MNSLQRGSLLLLAPLLGASALGFHEGLFATSIRSASLSQPRRLVEQPSQWVSFSAELKRVHEIDGSTFVGRQHRDADGSTRNETGRSFDAINSIAIKNIPEATFYRWTPEQGWASQPMVLPLGGWVPIETSFSQRLTEVADTVEGFSLVRLESAGRVFFQAPQLNLFTLVTHVKCKYDASATCGTWYSNITLGEPAVSFSPPEGAPISELKEPGGIVWKPAAQ